MIIVHADRNHPSLLKELARAGHDNLQAYDQTREEILEKPALLEGLVIRSRFRIDSAFIDAAPNLRFFARVGAGMEYIDVAYAMERGIALFSAPEGNSNAVGEHALGMLLSLMNKLHQADRQVRAGKWLRENNRGVELEGKTIGIVGYGNMGKSFARKLQGFEVRVICYDIVSGKGDENAVQVDLAEFRKSVDVVSLHTPWTDLTDRMIDADFISAIEKPFWFINTARGKSVVTEDLVDGLRKGKVLGAALDVLEYEKSSFESLFQGKDSFPDPLRELLQMENVLLSPHVAGWTVESHRKLATTIASKIISSFGEAS